MRGAAEIAQFGVLGALGIAGAVVLWGSLTNWQQVGDGAKYDGMITKAANDVRVRPPRDLSWHQANAQSGLNFGDQIFVGKDSSANVEAPQVKLEISENSLLSLDRTRDTSTVDLKEGGVNIALTDAKPVKFTLNERTVSVKGSGSEVALNRHQNGDTTELGLSFIKGKGQVVSPTGEKIQNGEGQALVFLSRPGEKVVVTRYKLKGLEPKNGSAFLQKQKVAFAWNAEGPDLEDVNLDFSQDLSFRLDVTSVPVKVGKSELALPLANEPGTYFWRVRGRTKSGLRLVGQSLRFEVVELRALNLIDPSFKFVKPGVWSAGLVLEEIPFCSHYEIQMARTADFKKIFAEETSFTYEHEVRFTEWGRFFVRARAVFDTITRRPPWSESVTLEIPKPLPPPELKRTPIAAAKHIQLNWPVVPEVDFYELQASVDASFTKPEILNLRELTFTLPMLKETPRYVRGISHQKNGVYGFPGEAQAVPGFVEPLEIVEANIRPPYHPRFKKGGDAELTLTWKGKTYPGGVQVEWAANENLKGARSLNTKQNTVILPVKDPHDLFIRMVQITDSHMVSFHSQIRHVPYPVLTPLDVPALIGPKDREVFFLPEVRPQIQFSWNAEGRFLGYDVQMARDEAFKKILRQEIARENKFVSPQALPGGELFWRVRGFDDFQESKWSSPRRIKVSYGH